MLHERMLEVQEAEGVFGLSVSKLESSDVEKPLTHEDAVEAYTYCLGLLNGLSKVNVSSFDREVEKLFAHISDRFQLTFGEKVKVLASQMGLSAKFIIKDERQSWKQGGSVDET